MTGESILIVEDEGLIAMSLQELLERSGFRVSGHASSGKEVLVHLREKPGADLILMDITLHGPVDGIATAQEIRKSSDIPIIFVSAHSNPNTHARAGEIGSTSFITKPFRDRDLIAAVEKALSR